jgi:lipopolysaccharide transport system permease protein
VFVDAINSPIKLVGESKAMLSKINFPREALVIAGLGEVLFNFVIRLVLLAAVFIWYEATIPATILIAPFGVLFLIGLGLTIGLLLTPLAMLYHDIGKGVAIGTQLLFFLTPVIYPLPQGGVGAFVARVNPITPLLVTTREWLMTGNTVPVQGFWMVCSSSVVLLLCGWLLYRLAMPHLIARMNA